MEVEVWECSWLWTCHVTWNKEMQESHGMEWRFCMDQYVSCCLPNEDLSLEIIWSKYEDFCKLQTNEFRARFDLHTSFRQGNRSVNEWYNGVQAEVYLCQVPTRNCKYVAQRYILDFTERWGVHLQDHQWF